MIYRNAQVTGEVTLGETAAADAVGEIRVVAREGGVAAVHGGDVGVGGAPREVVECPVAAASPATDRGVVGGGEVQQVVDHEGVLAAGLNVEGMALLGGELRGAKAGLEEFRGLHFDLRRLHFVNASSPFFEAGMPAEWRETAFARRVLSSVMARRGK